jgi:alginate O-acetyltransferase complex protein AlgI
MTFTSFNFLIFFPLLALLYWITPAKFRWLLLLIASYFFYINIKPVFALLLAGITLCTYLFTRLIDETNAESKKKRYMAINIVLILLPLLFFKYFSMLNDGIIAILELNHIRWPLPEIKLILPVGISFYTFMAIGYTVDVYNEEIKADKNLGIVALFLSFFPLILSGPIERAKNMLPQFTSKRSLNYTMVVQGLKMMVWGYFMKLVVADRIGIYIDLVYSKFSYFNGTNLLIASILCPFQLYADLGGYSLIAIGTAKILGINVMQNFNRPFLAKSMSELWRRWHISLISWLTDYVYTPLSFAFRKYRLFGIALALLLTFIISGIWHGAAITFMIWGLMQGVFLSIEALTSKKRTEFETKHNLKNNRLYTIIGICFTFILFAASLILGRAANLSEALNIYEILFSTTSASFIGLSLLTVCIIGLVVIFINAIIHKYSQLKFFAFIKKHKTIGRFTKGISIAFILFALLQILGKTVHFNSAFYGFKNIVSSLKLLYTEDHSTLILSVLSVCIILFKDVTDEFAPSKFLFFENKHKIIRVMAYSSTIILILLIGVLDGGQFIYFQF